MSSAIVLDGTTIGNARIRKVRLSVEFIHSVFHSSSSLPMDSVRYFPTYLNNRLFELVSHYHILDFAFAIGMARRLTDKQKATIAKARDGKKAKAEERAQAQACKTRSRIPRSTGQTPAAFNGIVSGRVSKKWAGKTKHTRSRGLYNEGNFCYRNSVLQCLFHLPEFFEYLHGLHQECDKTRNECVVCALQDLIQTYWCSYWCTTGLPFSCRLLKQAVNSLTSAIDWTISPEHDLHHIFKNKLQGDSFDFLKYLFDDLRKTEEQTDDLRYDNLFAIHHKSQWTCSDCNATTSRSIGAEDFGHGIGISVNIQQPERRLPMVEYLRRNEYEEQLQIRCESAECIEKFGEDQDGKLRTRRTYITQAPEVLFIRLGRFAQKGITASGQVELSKITDDVKFEEYLNLGEFTESGEPLFYQLQGVVAHRGQLQSGHYLAAVRTQDGKTCCSISDDTFIGKGINGTIQELEWPGTKDDTFDPYVLVYSKV